MPNTPCKECGERKIGCHARCVRYLEFSKKRTHILAERFKENEKYGACIAQKQKQYFKNMLKKEHRI